MSKKISLIIIVLVILGAAIVTYFSIARHSASPNTVAINQPVQQTSDSSTNSTSSAGATQTYTAHPSIVSALPGPKASTSDVEAYVKQVDAASSQSTNIDITGCAASPDIIKAKIGSSLSFTNNDGQPHTISYPLSGILLDPGTVSPNGQVVVPANGQAQLSLNGVPRGVYGLGCDATTRSGNKIGILYVTP